MIALEYKVRMRTTRCTSGHEAEELEDFLNTEGEGGWILHTIIHGGRDQMVQTLIFIREGENA